MRNNTSPLKLWHICLLRTEASLPLTEPSTAHSLLIYQSHPPSQFSQLQPGPCDLLPVSFDTVLVSFDVSINSTGPRTESLNRGRGWGGDYVPAASRGGTFCFDFFLFFYIYRFNSYFILSEGFGPCFLQGLALQSRTWLLILLLSLG